ncbi:sulfite exporter TauE/SafE family protein, partial [Actinomyces slackii]
MRRTAPPGFPSQRADAQPWGRRALAGLVGAGAGLLSGLFGVGGGIVLVPALVVVLGLDQRRAAATSLVAIMPAALVGALSYGLRGEVSLIAAALLVLGSLLGTQIGVRLLHRLPTRALSWVFVAFIIVVLIGQRL